MVTTDECWTIARHLAHDAWLDYMRQISPQIYLYLLPRGDGSSNPVLRRDGAPVNGLTLAENEAIPRHLNEEQLMHWLYPRLRRLPILPVAEDPRRAELRALTAKLEAQHMQVKAKLRHKRA